MQTHPFGLFAKKKMEKMSQVGIEPIIFCSTAQNSRHQTIVDRPSAHVGGKHTTDTHITHGLHADAPCGRLSLAAIHDPEIHYLGLLSRIFEVLSMVYCWRAGPKQHKPSRRLGVNFSAPPWGKTIARCPLPPKMKRTWHVV